MRCYGILLLALLAGCENSLGPTTKTAPPPGSSSTDNSSVRLPADGATSRDNTAVNTRDQSSSTKTPFDQGQGADDIKVTADIRTKIVNHSGMSINGRNVKIITENGKVTLRGPVSSQEEKDVIDKFAKDTSGAVNVDNQIEIAP
ncbi:outer membrane lipoprotein [Anatilimnocola aggregata]|uniref:Outer membrane lipoprotein n=1 Tax=Anatilimnocola aggregata TaxID=2528021 RepID=A0A517YN92_9BACT|nr:BON domain-containing protein [Anatilimnocola aggregata]QDU31683.1 outer membrane lipoprotein [Anatilimnocola aggregata]